ncbi:hypothetical protein BO71DRAFT_118050 [Aspergillus ellipticus CBS 707.79]|uniref:Uncharacterized protein n=1 Tax=Aspergillus ellipticus CBS 707.79 TaxID=1448320 RepID=A0A319CW80_9EURO|nr:hypothetical protein BO71DRAFT_118050 [Aspergillus ellipticus CBS 707.79]
MLTLPSRRMLLMRAGGSQPLLMTSQVAHQSRRRDDCFAAGRLDRPGLRRHGYPAAILAIGQNTNLQDHPHTKKVLCLPPYHWAYGPCWVRSLRSWCATTPTDPGSTACTARRTVSGGRSGHENRRDISIPARGLYLAEYLERFQNACSLASPAGVSWIGSCINQSRPALLSTANVIAARMRKMSSNSWIATAGKSPCRLDGPQDACARFFQIDDATLRLVSDQQIPRI